MKYLYFVISLLIYGCGSHEKYNDVSDNDTTTSYRDSTYKAEHNISIPVCRPPITIHFLEGDIVHKKTFEFSCSKKQLNTSLLNDQPGWQENSVDTLDVKVSDSEIEIIRTPKDINR